MPRDGIDAIFTAVYVLVVPLLGLRFNRILRARFVDARTGRSDRARHALAVAYAVYIIGYGMIVWLTAIYRTEDPLARLLIILLLGVGLLPLIVDPKRKWYPVAVAGFAWGLAGVVSLFEILSNGLMPGGGFGLDNYFLFLLSRLLKPLCGLSSGPCYFLSDVWFLLQFLVPSLAGYLVAWLRQRHGKPVQG